MQLEGWQINPLRPPRVWEEFSWSDVPPFVQQGNEEFFMDPGVSQVARSSCLSGCREEELEGKGTEELMQEVVMLRKIA